MIFPNFVCSLCYFSFLLHFHLLICYYYSIHDSMHAPVDMCQAYWSQHAIMPGLRTQIVQPLQVVLSVTPRDTWAASLGEPICP